MRNSILLLLPLALVISCSTGGTPTDTKAEISQVSEPAAATMSESEISLASGPAREQPPQAPIAFNQVDPGESELRPRPNEEFPPVIPHTIDDLETLTLNENSCLECHDPSVAEDMGAVAVPASHRVDIRNSPETTGEETVGARWVCTSCHVAQTESEPLVGVSPQG